MQNGRLVLSVCVCSCVLVLCVRSGTQIDAKESDMSDTLSPSKDRSSDDTSGQYSQKHKQWLHLKKRKKVMNLNMFWDLFASNSSAQELAVCILHKYTLPVPFKMHLCLETTYKLRYLCVSDGNMEDQELIEPQNRVALLKGENVPCYLCIAVCCTYRRNIWPVAPSSAQFSFLFHFFRFHFSMHSIPSLTITLGYDIKQF